MSHRWNDFGGYTDHSLNQSTSSNYEPTNDEPFNSAFRAAIQEQQQERGTYHSTAQSVHDSPITSYSASGVMDNSNSAMDYPASSTSFYESMGGGQSVNPAATMDMDYDLSGVSNVVGSPAIARTASFDVGMGMSGGPTRATSMTGLESRMAKNHSQQYRTTSAAEAFARLRAGSISITPSSAQPGLSTTMEIGGSSSGSSHQQQQPLHPPVASAVPRSTRNSIPDMPMRAFSYPARLPQVSPRQSFSSASHHPHQNLHFSSPVPTSFPSYQSNPPYEATAGPTFDMYETPADMAYSLNEGSLSGFANGIEAPSATTTPTPESYRARQRSIAKGGGYSHRPPELQPQPPPAPQPSQNSTVATTPLGQTSLYSASGFDLIGVLARVVGRKDPVINLGSIDMSCSFIVSDAKDPELSSIYVSESFCKLTGYNQEEILGRSCRFLQAPGDQPVRKGEKRRYTDSNAAHHLRTNLENLHECQVSLINYQKGGKPFINLVTCIPISWNNTGEIDFIVGFQVDLVDQPAAILDKTTNGSYVVNYSIVHATIARNPSLSSADVASAIEQLEEAALGFSSSHHPHQLEKPDSTMSIQSVREQVSTTDPSEVIDLVAQHGLASVSSDAIRKQFMRLMVDQSDDLIHVLSLKGALLYVSPAARNLLEYEPSELLGKTLASFCHPSDIVSVQRELKDAGASNHASVNLVYRIRRKHSGYMWFEASGRLHLEQGKGRKCVILSGRPREVYKMSWQDLERAGGMGENEFWAKVCVDGIFLTATRSAANVLGSDPKFDVVGKSFVDLSPQKDATGVMRALVTAAEGTPSQVQHQLVGPNGPVDVVTHFYPARTDQEDHPAPPALPAVGQKNVSVIAQINLLSSEMSKRRTPLMPSKAANQSFSDSTSTPTPARATTGPVTLALPAFGGRASGGSAPSTTSPAGSSFSAVPSTFKALGSPNAHSDNVFDELNVTRGTSWQFELHQMRLTNKKLREEKEALSAMKRKREESVKSASSVKGGNAPRACANCGRTSSAEWRSGPTGPKTLCNACGLRWSKARSQAQAADGKKKGGGGDASSSSATPVPLQPPKKHVMISSGSEESRPGSGSDSRGGNSTNPTTNSPSSQSYPKAFSPPDHKQLQPSQGFAPNYGESPAQPSFFSYPHQHQSPSY
ncbi:uncharacterized protein JCM6883_003141 [Sporobolomyces salmoneus]|uniref:uncharacterized protein n=1 Tax=Sporobolomyces salmoneus TaxID=183962 RepID=UPI003170A4AF